jgi:hypothetical protein
LPLLEKRPVSMMRTAGNNWRGMERRIAIESVVSRRFQTIRRTEELRRLDKLFLLGKIDENDSLDIAAIGRVAKDTEPGKQDGHSNHDPSERTRELVWLLHGLGNGNNPVISLGLVKVRMTYSPMPSNAKTAVPMRRGKLARLKRTTSAGPFCAIVPISQDAI